MIFYMFFKIAHIQIFLVAALHLTVVKLSFIFAGNMNVLMLLEIRTCGELFGTFSANKSLLVFVDFLVPVQIGFLNKTNST